LKPARCARTCATTVGVERRAVAEHDRRDDGFAPRLVRHADDARLADVGMREKHALDLGREDALAGAPDDSFRRPTTDRKPSSSNAPRSPVCTQPSRFVRAVSSGFRQ
jgi:hypothetical protein